MREREGAWIYANLQAVACRLSNVGRSANAVFNELLHSKVAASHPQATCFLSLSIHFEIVPPTIQCMFVVDIVVFLASPMVTSSNNVVVPGVILSTKEIDTFALLLC